MLSGFRNFVSTAWNAVTGFFSKIGSWFGAILGGTKSEVKENEVHWTFPDYTELAKQLGATLEPEGMAEVTSPGDKGRMIAQQIKDYQLVQRKLSPNQAAELELNVSNVASWLGFAFETGVVLYLIQQKGLQLQGANWTVNRLRDRHNVFVGRVRDNYKLSTRSTRARDKFIELLQHNIAKMAEEIHDKSLQMLKCQKLQFIEYIGFDQHMAARSPTTVGQNVGGADLIVSCAETGELSYWSTKYTSNPHSSIAKKSPADVHALFGGRGARSDAYYYRLTNTFPPEVAADAVLYDLWDSLTHGFAVDGPYKHGSLTVRLKGEWAVSMFQELLRGDVGTNPAWLNYTRGNMAVGDYSPAFQRDFRMGKDDKLHARTGAYAEATLEGAYKKVTTKPGAKRPKPAIKVKLVTPGQQGMRQTYLKFYVNPAPPDEDRYSKYNVQIQMNNLTTQ